MQVVAATSDYEGKTMMLGHVLILDSCSGVVMHSMSTKLQPCHPKVLEPPSALVERFMATWRSVSLCECCLLPAYIRAWFAFAWRC